MKPVPAPTTTLVALMGATVAALILFGPGARSASAQYEDTLPPTVEITEAPKSELKTHKRRKPVLFAFTSDDPLATFTCRLDRSGYLPCTSPVQLYLKAGKGQGVRHTFFVRSADLAGNSSGVSLRSVRVQRLKPYR